MLLSYLSQMQGIARCAHQHSCINFLNCSQTLQAIHPPARNGESTEAFGSLIGRPETNKRAKTKGQKDDIITSNTCCLVDAHPTFCPPVPAFLRIKNLQRSSSGSRCLMQTNIFVERVG